METSRGSIEAPSIVIATGGLTVPKIGATPFAYRIAEQFGLAVIAPKPALVPLTFEPEFLGRYGELAGVSLDAETSCAGGRFRENILFTHRGLSGPAILQIEEAKAVCRRCEVREQCLQWALEAGQDHGVWGGLSEDERRALKRRNAGARVRTA